MKSAIIYLRVSTDEQAKSGYSLPNQEFVLTKYCELNNIKVIQIFKEDYSAKNFIRPEYKKLFQYCKSNKKDIDYVFVTKWDRFSRNQSDAFYEIKEIKKLAIEVNAVEQWIDFNIPQNKVMLSIYLAMPEIDNDIRGINTKMGLRRSLKEGRWTGVAPLGYKNARDHNNKPILIHSLIAPIVKETFEEFATGLYSKEELRKKMVKKGLKLSRSRFPEMLQNIIYTGKVFISADNYEEAEIKQGIHPPIVSEEIFNKVQRIIKGKKNNHRKHYEKLNPEAPLRNLLTCKTCGAKLTSSSSKGRSKYYIYYHCHNYCKERIPAHEAHAALKQYFESVKVAPEIAELYISIMCDLYKDNEKDKQKDITKIRGQLNDVEIKLTHLEEKYIIEDIQKDSYNFMKPKYKSHIEELKEKIEELQSTDTDFDKFLKFGVNLIQNLNIYYEKASIENKQKIIGSIFPEDLSIENNECRTSKENEVIVVLNGFERDFKRKKLTKKSAFPVGYTANFKYLTISNLIYW